MKSWSELTDDQAMQRVGQELAFAYPELTDEQREMVKRLPLSASYPLEERKATHRWCTRCWYEAVDTPTNA